MSGHEAVRGRMIRRVRAGLLGLSRRATIVVAIAGVAGLLTLSEEMHGRFVALLAVVDPLFTRHSALGALLFVGLAAISAVMVFFSSVVLVPLGVRAWGETGCFLLLWCGWFLGGMATYAAGRLLGRPVVRRMLTSAEIERYERLIPHGGTLLTTVLLQLALPSDVSGYFFGLLGYRARLYFTALALAELPYALGTVFIGSAFIRREHGLLLSGSAVAAAALVWGWRRRRRGAAARA